MKFQAMKIRFYVLRSKQMKNGEVPILLRVTIEGVHEETRIQRSIKPEDWNQAAELCTSKDKKSREINEYIHHLNNKALDVHKELTSKEAYINPGIIIKRLFGKEEQITVLKTFQEHIEECRSLIGVDYAYSTINRYDNCFKTLATVIKMVFDKDEISYQEFNHELIKKYEAYLKIEKNLANNTVVRYMKVIKKMTNIALANGWLKSDPFAGVKFRQTKTTPVFLTMDEIEMIRTKKFSIKRIELVRDVFIFCCFTGLAFIDVTNLSKDDLIKDSKGKLWIRKTRQKTNVVFNIPLMNIPLEILDKYKDHEVCLEMGVLLPVMSNQKMNSYLKEIGDLCGIDKPLTMHVARHSFATSIALANGVSLSNVSSMLGHTSTRMTEHYAKVLDQSILSDMAQVQKIINNA